MVKHFASSIVGLALLVSPVAAQDVRTSAEPTQRIILAQAASSCSAWKSICDSRGPGCAAKFTQCLKSGCWTEGKAHGGATHCSLAKK